MLTGLYIEHLAVIEKAYLDFAGGLNVFTGETGAGKSIVIDAINLVLGQRGSRDIIRTGEKKAVVSAVFSDLSPTVCAILEQLGLEPENDELILQRELGADGKSSARVCSRPVAVSVLKELGAELINIHGQHDSQALLNPDRHLDLLDSYGDAASLLREYQAAYAAWKETHRQLSSLEMDEAEKNRRIDLLRFQAEEIEAAGFVPGEEEELEVRKKAAANASKILEGLGDAYQNLYGVQEQEGALDQVSSASEALSYAGEYYDELKETAERLAGVLFELQDVAALVSDSFHHLEFDPQELDEVESRLAELDRLKRKYGPDIPAILAFGENACAELERIETADWQREQLEARQETQYQEVLKLAETLSKHRQEAARRFVNQIREELRFLDMPHVKLGVHFEQGSPWEKGIDRIEFLISTNPGEPPKPIAKIASGGELSRIMLGIKNTLADKDKIPTLIFDEIDTGVSGRAAQKIGLKLREVSRNRQVLCVTHSAQVAALADTHFLIQKSVEGERTFTKVTPLDFEGRKRELARIMGTDQITDLMLQNAEEMLNAAKNS